jgi:hypothetical protein
VWSLFVHAVPDNRGKKGGYYCSLVESRRINGTPSHSTILSFGYVPPERLPYLKAAFNSGDPEVIFAKAKRSQEKKRAEPASGRASMEKAKLEFVAKITMPDGKVIERRVDAGSGIPAPDDFDTSSKGGFLESFDILEKVTLEARNRIAVDITEAYLEEVSKKNE